MSKANIFYEIRTMVKRDGCVGKWTILKVATSHECHFNNLGESERVVLLSSRSQGKPHLVL